jgi:thioredoxin reductase (NADPH)
MDNNYDIIIIGAGPAGITAAIYGLRANIKILLIDKATPGGKLNKYEKLDNYPGVINMSAPELAYQLYEQINQLGISVTYGDVISLTKEEQLFQVTTDEQIYQAKVVIVASGTSERKLGIPGEEAYIGRGVSYCATCDAAFFKGKDVAVVGSNAKAIEEAIFLAAIVNKVYIINRTDKLSINDALIAKMKEHHNIENMPFAVAYQIIGDQVVTGLNIRNPKPVTLSVSAVFPYVGSAPNTSFITFNEVLDKNGYIIVDENMATTIPGLFASGDVIVKNLRQIVTAASDGAIASFSANRYLKKTTINN